MTGHPELFIDESQINKKYFPSFAIVISTLITEKIPLGQLTPWANKPPSPLCLSIPIPGSIFTIS